MQVHRQSVRTAFLFFRFGRSRKTSHSYVNGGTLSGESFSSFVCAHGIYQSTLVIHM